MNGLNIGRSGYVNTKQICPENRKFSGISFQPGHGGLNVWSFDM